MARQLRVENVLGKFVVCPSKSCGVLSNPGSNFCTSCGQNLQSENPRSRLPKPRILEDGTNTHAELGGLTPSEFREAARPFEQLSQPGVRQIDLSGFSPNVQTAASPLAKHVGSVRHHVETNQPLPPKILEALKRRAAEEKKRK